MILTIAKIIVIWTLASIPIALIVGRFIAGKRLSRSHSANATNRRSAALKG